MLFVEIKFFLFFAIVLLVYWLLPKNTQRKNFLLLASYYFYGSWDWRFAIMLFLISTGDYLLARWISREEDGRRRKLYVTLSLTMNLGVLAYFKYMNFFIDSAVSLAAGFGMHLSHPTLNIVLPVGISFLTFQSLSYTIDVYRRQLEPARKMRDYLLFSSFFPQLVAGPIVRPAYFLPQLKESRSLDSAQLRSCLLLFLVGFFKKTCIADNIAPFVDQVFNAPHLYGHTASITAVWLYAVQIFCDFSGYSDMAIAVAGLMGYKLVINFNAPYLSTSIQNFWRRWHISLSNWIRDYIYISLGGRASKHYITYRNLLLTMLAGGLWHGAAWNFVIWGGLHGVALVVNHEFVRHFTRDKPKTILRECIGWFLTINFVCGAWIFFRAANFDTAWLILKRYLWLDLSQGSELPFSMLLFAPALLGIEYIARRYRGFERASSLPLQYFAVLYGVAWALTLALLPLGNHPFIYFQF